MHEWAKDLKDEYNAAQKRTKNVVVKKVLALLQQLSPPGRVLLKKRYGDDEYYVELKGSSAIEKIRYYCFRYNTETTPTPSLSFEQNNSIGTKDKRVVLERVSQRTIPLQRNMTEVYISADEVKQTDVICRRGSTGNSHPGFLKFRSVIAANKQEYDQKPSRDRDALARQIFVDSFKSEGVRFVRAVSEDTYVVLDDDKCSRKIWAALRDHRGSTSTVAATVANLPRPSKPKKSNVLQEQQMEVQNVLNDLITTVESAVVEREEVQHVLNDLITVVDSLASDESLPIEEEKEERKKEEKRASIYTQNVAIIAPPGQLGLVLEAGHAPSSKGSTMVGKMRLSSVMAKQMCPGDRILAIDGEDVSNFSLLEVLSIMKRKHDVEKVLVIEPNPISTMAFTNPPKAPPSYQSSTEILVLTYVKAHIVSNRLRYNSVRVLLQLPPILLSREVGGRLSELHTEHGSNFDLAWCNVKNSVIHWYVFYIDSKRRKSLDMPTTPIKAPAPIMSTFEDKMNDICDYVKTSITKNQMQDKDVRDLLRLSPSSILQRVGGKLLDLHNELGSGNFDIVWSRAKKHILYWHVSTFDERMIEASHTAKNTSLTSSTSRSLEAIVDGKVVKVKVTQDSAPSSKLVRHKKPSKPKRMGNSMLQLAENAASLQTCVTTQKESCIMLRKYITNADIPSLLAGMNMLVSAMKAHADRGAIQTEAILSLTQMVWNHPSLSLQIAKDESCLQLAVDAFERHGTKTQQAAVDFFVALSYHLECCQAMLDTEVISSVLKSIKRNSSKVNVLGSVYLYLQNMAAVALDTVVKDITEEHDIISALLQNVRTKASCTKMMINACGLLSNIALHPDGSLCIMEEGGTDILKKVIVSTENTHTMQTALIALRNLALNDSVAKHLMNHGFASKVIDIGRASRGNPELLLVSLSLLDKLVDSEVAANQNALASGAEMIALAAINDHSGNNELRLVAISLLQKVAE